jgi:hypothetical protein
MANHVQETTGTTLIVHMAGLGDLVVALPALAALAAARPGERFTFAADRTYREIVSMAGLPFTPARLAELPWRALWDHSQSPETAGVPRFDRVIELWTLGGRERRYAAATGGTVICLPPDPGHASQGDMSQRAFAWVVEALGLDLPYREAVLEPGMPARQEVAAYMDARGVHPPYAVIAPGAGNPCKCWPESRHWDLAESLRRDRGLQVVVVLGERECARGMAAPAGSADYVCREWGIRDVAALIGGASVYVGNDSGLSHVAVWAAGSQRPRTPCVLVFPRLNVRNWGTNRPWVKLVEYRYCQRDLPTVETVLNAVIAAMR